MVSAETIFQIPDVLRVLCYLGAMAVFAAEILWLSRYAYGRENVYSLRDITQLWLIRVLVGCVFLSFAHMVFVREAPFHPGMALPEIAILFLVFALDLLSIEKRPLDWKNILMQRLPRGLMMVFVVMMICCALWVVAFGMGWGSVKVFSLLGTPDWLPFFTLCLLWNSPLVFLFLKIGQHENHSDLKFHNLFWPVMLAYSLILLPDAAEHVGNRFIELQLENQGKPIPRI